MKEITTVLRLEFEEGGADELLSELQLAREALSYSGQQAPQILELIKILEVKNG